MNWRMQRRGQPIAMTGLGDGAQPIGDCSITRLGQVE